MKRGLIYASLAFGLASCQSPQMEARLRYPQLEVTGAAAGQLSKQDIFDIVDVALQHPKMLKPIHQIALNTPNCAEVTGGSVVENPTWTVVKLCKTAGHWTLIKNSFYYPRALVGRVGRGWP